MKTKLLAAFLFSICTLAGFAQTGNIQRLAGSWMGSVDVNSIPLRVIFKFKINGDTVTVTLDSPDQGAKNIPLKGGKIVGDSVFIDAPNLRGSYLGIMQPGDSLINGTWTQAGIARALTLHHLAREFVMNRPQEPKEPFPYQSEDLVFKNEKAGIDLAGTLTLPQGKGPFPAVVLVTGSGPQNRNEELLGHKPFLLISDYLTRNGIAVLRFDDRGTFKSKGSFADATTFDFADDAEAAFDYLLGRKEIDPHKIGIAGHSEGGMIAPIVAARNSKVAFIILLAGPGTTGEEILIQQERLISKAMGLSDDKILETRKENEKIFSVLKTEPDFNKAAKAITAMLEADIDSLKDTSAEDKTKARKNILTALMQVNNKWFRTFLVFDPHVYLKQVKCPVLALNGENDLQVPCDENIGEIEKTLKKAGNRKVTVKKFPGLNHLFQHSATGLPSEYGKIEETMSPEVLQVMKDWVLKVTK